MSKRNFHSLPFYLKLSPFIVNSLLMHVIVLSFLVTLPIYSKANEKESLLGYYVYLMGEKTNNTQASTGRIASEKQIEAAKNMEKAIIPEKIIDDVKNKEEMTPSAGQSKETDNNDINMENITGERPSIIKLNESDTDGKLMDVKPSFTGPKKEDEIIPKETEIIDKTKTATPVLAAEPVDRTEKSAGPRVQNEAISSGIDKAQKKNVENISGGDGRNNIERPFADLKPPSKIDASVREMKLPARISMPTGPTSVAIIEKDKMSGKGKYKTEKLETPEQVKSIQVEKKLPIITTENIGKNSLLKKGGTDLIPASALKAKETAPVSQQEDYPGTAEKSEAFLSGTDNEQKEKTIPSSTDHTQMEIEKPVVVMQPASGKDVSETEMNLPERNSQITVQPSAEIVKKAATIEKKEAETEKPLTPDQALSVNNVVRTEKHTIYKSENKKALSEKSADTPAENKILPMISAKKPVEKARIKNSPAYEMPSFTSKTEETVSGEKNEKIAEASEAIVNPELSKKIIQAERAVQSLAREESGQKDLSIKKEKVLSLLPDIDNVIKKAFSELQPANEKTPGLRSEVKLPVTPSALAGGAPKSYNRTEKAGAYIKYDKVPEKNETPASKIKDKVEKGSEAEQEKSVLGLSVDESFFNKDIKIEVLQKNAESHGVYMYLLKNTYFSLRKRHTWGKEKKIETMVETKRKDSAVNEMKTVFSVAKSDEGIYTFVIENRNTVPYNSGIVFVLYGGQKRERIKKIDTVSVPPSSVLRFMFVLPDTVFWDDEKFFSGSIEDSDSITKFNDETGFVWKEEKDN